LTTTRICTADPIAAVAPVCEPWSEWSETSADEPEEVTSMGAVLILTFLVLIAPLSYLYGVDSRRATDRGWVAGRR
jgi:hypothetical protein